MHVFAIDKIGCGFTDNPKSDEEYIIGTTVQHAYDFLNTMKIDSAHVVGHSRGGYAVCRLALEHPEVVKSLVLVDSATLMVPSLTIYNEWDRQAALLKDIRERYHYIVAANSFGSEHITDDFVDVMVEIMTLPKTQMHILNQAGHYCFREQPEAFVAAVTSFIKLNSGMS